MAHEINRDRGISTIPPRILMGPGPSMAHPRVLQAMMQNMIGYLDPDFITVMDDVVSMLKKVFGTTQNTLAISGTGSAGMESGLSSLLEPGDRVIMCVYGFFCERMVDMAERIGAEVIPIRADWGKPFPEELLEKALRTHTDVKMVTAIHGETSTGVSQPLEALSALAKQSETLFMVDTVTTLGGNEVTVDRWEIDYAYSASQKCLGAPPGMAPVAFSDKSLNRIRNRDTKPSSWYLDLNLLSKYWGEERVYHHTAPVSMLLGLREALSIVLDEGLKERYERHKKNARALVQGLQALGLKTVAPEESRLDQITPVWIPEGVDDDLVRGLLLEEDSIEIGKGLGDFAGKVWRIGLMGESSKKEYVLMLLSAMERILPRAGYEVAMGEAVSAASRVYSED